MQPASYVFIFSFLVKIFLKGEYTVPRFVGFLKKNPKNIMGRIQCKLLLFCQPRNCEGFEKKIKMFLSGTAKLKPLPP
jgi:hypothetical protein